MPFTLAHPAAVLPFRRYGRRHTSLSALVLGSMMPDLGYFFPLHVPGAITHSIAGLFVFCLPAGLLAYVLFQSVLRRPLIALAPDAISARLDMRHEWLPTSAGALIAILSSIVIGAATHVGWDAFTHPNTAIGGSIGFLRALVGPAGGPQVPLHKFLQYFSGVFGLAILAACIAKWMRLTPRAHSVGPLVSRRCRLAVVGGILAAGAAGSAAKALSWQGETAERIVFGAITGGMAAMMVAMTLVCACWHVWAFCRDYQNRSNSPR
jgi:Domain of unknown function (DUF4184)